MCLQGDMFLIKNCIDFNIKSMVVILLKKYVYFIDFRTHFVVRCIMIIVCAKVIG